MKVAHQLRTVFLVHQVTQCLPQRFPNSLCVPNAHSLVTNAEEMQIPALNVFLLTHSRDGNVYPHLIMDFPSPSRSH